MWSHLRSILSVGEDHHARSLIPNGTNIVSLQGMREEALLVRTKIDWGMGHSVGRAPQREDFIWCKGTIFLAYPA